MSFTSKTTLVTNVDGSDKQKDRDHASIHNDVNSVVNSLQDKVGIDSSTDTSSLDYQLNSTSSSDPGHKHTLANGATDVTASVAELNIMDGVTASTAELNVLDGIPGTLTATELGYVDGVTSAIQTQMNLKSPIASPTFTGTVTIPTPFTIDSTSMTSTAAELNQLDGVTVGGTSSGDIVDLDTAQTLTNKTLSTGVAVNSSANENITSSGIRRQGIINGGLSVGQRPDGTLSTSVVYGGVDRIYAIAEGTVGAGTIVQDDSSIFGGSSTYSIGIEGVTLTGAGKVKIGYRMEAADVAMYLDNTISFSCYAYHNVGSTKNYTIYVNEADATDDFSSVTQLDSDTGTLDSITPTLITFEGIDISALTTATTGLEIIVEIDCGAITTKNFYFSQLQLNTGSAVLPFQAKTYAQEESDCQRFYYRMICANSFMNVGSGPAAGTPSAVVKVPIQTSMRAAPTPSIGTIGNFIARGGNTTNAATAIAYVSHDSNGVNLRFTAAVTANYNYTVFTVTNSEYLILDAEL